MVDKNKKTWPKKLLEVLWAYRTTVTIATHGTPYSLVFGGEAVLLLEIQLPSLRVAVQERITTEEKAGLHFAELETLDENRLEAQQNLKLYSHWMSKAFNKWVRFRSFQKGDLVLPIGKRKGKLEPNWEDPFAIEKAYSNGTHLLITLESDQIIPPTNARFLKKYYP